MSTNHRPVRTRIAGIVALALAVAPFARAQTGLTIYRGMCDASAAIALDTAHFVVANDERNTLIIYRIGDPAPGVRLDLSGFLGTKTDKESDLEGAAQIGDRIYWISSHGRNSKGDEQPRRYRFFATDIKRGANPPTVAPVGQPYQALLTDLKAAAALAKYDFTNAATKPPEADGGLNIEGLAATEDGKLMIGFRNPLSAAGRAIVVILDNPDELIAGKPARFGAPMEPDLGRRGIRSMERVGTDYLIIGGRTGDTGDFVLFRWSGKPAEIPAPVPTVALAPLRAEALFAIPGGDRVGILSDDGGIDNCKNRPPRIRHSAASPYGPDHARRTQPRRPRT